MRFSRKRSISRPSQKNGCCGRCLCPRTVRNENGLRDDRGGPLECRRAGGRAHTKAQRPPAVIRSLPKWFEHYNQLHPHHALGYLSPREFIAKMSTEKSVDPVSGI